MTPANSCTLYHNPRCSKSRAVKTILEERGVPFQEALREPVGKPRELAGQLAPWDGDGVRASE